MSRNIVKIGDPIRAEGSAYFGTIGCFAKDDNATYVVSCDHVVKATAAAQENGGFRLCPPIDQPQFDIAYFEGRSLCKNNDYVADIAISEISSQITLDNNIPVFPNMPEITKLKEINIPREGDQIWIWGALTKKYHKGLIVSPQSDGSWFHNKYGQERFLQQFSAILFERPFPDVGDSGGPVLTKEGFLVGFLAAISISDTSPNNSTVYCVPALSCFDILKIKLYSY